MSEETDRASDIALAQQLFATAIAHVSDRVKNANPEDQPGSDTFTNAVVTRLRQVLLELTRLLEQGLDQTVALSAAAGRGPPWIVDQGPFRAAIRVPGERPGAAAGRVPGLKWQDVEPGSENIPKELADEIRKIPEGTLGKLAMAGIEFCLDATLWHLWFPSGTVSQDRDADAFAIVAPTPSGTRAVLLNWTNEPIYQLNDLRLFRFSRSPHAYIRCFFHIVRGRLGRFTILENDDDIGNYVPWDAARDPSDIEKDRAKIVEKVRPLERKSMNAAGEMVYTGIVLFKNALFKTDIAMGSDGQLRLENEELLYEELAVNFV